MDETIMKLFICKVNKMTTEKNVLYLMITKKLILVSMHQKGGRPEMNTRSIAIDVLATPGVYEQYNMHLKKGRSTSRHIPEATIQVVKRTSVGNKSI